MDKIKTIALTVAVLGVLVLGGVALKSPALPSAEDVADVVSSRLGALVGPDIPYPHFSFGGVRRFAASKTLNQASTTVCSLQSPAASSTLISFSIQATTGTTTALLLEIGKSAQLDATTTQLGDSLALVGGPFTVVGSTTANNVTAKDQIFIGSRYLNFKIGKADANGTAKWNNLAGTCNATWEQI